MFLHMSADLEKLLTNNTIQYNIVLTLIVSVLTLNNINLSVFGLSVSTVQRFRFWCRHTYAGASEPGWMYHRSCRIQDQGTQRGKFNMYSIPLRKAESCPWCKTCNFVTYCIYVSFLSQQQTGANIKVYSQCAPQSTERVVQMIGKPDTVVNCIATIYDLLQTVSVILDWSALGFLLVIVMTCYMKQ